MTLFVKPLWRRLSFRFWYWAVPTQFSLGTGLNPQVRALNLTQQTTDVSYGFKLAWHTESGQKLNYAAELPGLNTVSFDVSGAPITSVNKVFQKVNAYTAVA